MGTVSNWFRDRFLQAMLKLRILELVPEDEPRGPSGHALQSLSPQGDEEGARGDLAHASSFE